MKTMNLQLRTASFITDLTYDALSADLQKDAKYRLLDWLGSALAGVGYRPSLIAAEFFQSAGGLPQATVLKGQAKVPVAAAAFANGIIGHVAEFDDGHRRAIAHPGSVTVPVALALAENYKRSGKEVLTAVVAGYEVVIRLGMCVNPSHYKIWHTTGTCGAIGAAATAAYLLRLDRQQTLMALGIAGTMGAGLQETFGTHAKALNAGHACQSGIQAALLAERGFTGPEEVIMGNKGFIKATTQEYSAKPLEEIGLTPLLSNTAFYKVYASCGHTNSPLDALFKLMGKQNIPLAAIRHIAVTTYKIAVDLTAGLKNENEEAAKFSLPYCLAVALIYKKVTLKEFTPDRLHDAEILTLARKITVMEDTVATAQFPKRRATIRIELDSGRVMEETVDDANDEPQYEALEDKFFSLAVSAIGSEAAGKTKEIILNIEKLDDLNLLMQYLT
ncbi:MmgE/PrpD family protein [Acetonema longum]|uniref:MmgE/PrpD family protein n=1 Tax=Acetonema longum DSM 6540 TaxID=1009370 RepID=F7NE31_9FIRM|nr:MmgE/PrpD family protein [Acetonema longum]EGO65686.1 MmgE/PrpD family protein [Acetonema longum DSM 6540]